MTQTHVPAHRRLWSGLISDGLPPLDPADVTTFDAIKVIYESWGWVKRALELKPSPEYNALQSIHTH